MCPGLDGRREWRAGVTSAVEEEREREVPKGLEVDSLKLRGSIGSVVLVE